MIISSPKINFYKCRKGRSRILRRLNNRNSLDAGKSGTLYPDGSFTLGFIPRKKVSAKDAAYQRATDEWDCNYSEQYQAGKGLVRKYSWVHQRDSGRFIDAPYLGKPRAARGTKGLTNYGKRYVRQSCYLLESKYGIKNLGFYTLTIPTCRVNEAWDIALMWTSIYKYFFKLLRNHLYASGIEEVYYVGVTENQSHRSKRDGCPYFHIHFVMPCYIPGTREYAVSANTLRSFWRRAITNFVPLDSRTSWGASVDSQVLRKSASGYLSKYFSKGSDLGEIYPGILPSSWYFSTLEMKAAYKAACRRLDTNICEYIVSNISDKSVVERWDFITTPDPFSDREVVRGYYGVLTLQAHISIYELLS